ncbi:hypothetical protein GL307_21290 [Nocardia seriolae]|nr:hypothetical protein [Nocardia seriolae]MTL14005.1 hypothetical protein [Nocardia seriolae]
MAVSNVTNSSHSLSSSTANAGAINSSVIDSACIHRPFNSAVISSNGSGQPKLRA